MAGRGVGIVLNIVGALAAFFVLQQVAAIFKGWRDNKCFAFISEKSMPLYLFHQQIIYFVIFRLNGKVNPCINVAINFVVAMAVSLLISTILMKFRITRILIGEK